MSTRNPPLPFLRLRAAPSASLWRPMVVASAEQGRHLPEKGICFGSKHPLPLRDISPKGGEKSRVMEDFSPF